MSHGGVMTDSQKLTSSPPRVGHRTRVAGLALAVATAVGVGVWMAPAGADTSTAVVHDGPGDDPGNAELRKELKNAHNLEGDERRDAMKGIREDARDGKYGDRVEQRSERRGDRHAAFEALLPDEMQADIKKAKEAEDADEAKALREDIHEKALAGGYGEKVKAAFEILEENRPEGRPQR